MEAASKAQTELERIEKQIEQLQVAAGSNQEAHKQLEQLSGRVDALRRQMSGKLSAWERTELARHPMRPYPLDYIERIFPDFSEIHGDRGFADDSAIVAGMARFNGREVAVIGTQKGRETKQRIYRNFGQPNPEGYRKALRIMRFAEKWNRPVITLIDVPGAYPGLGAEERGQAEAIAHNLREMARLKVPFIAAITGEGGSGPAMTMGGGGVGVAVGAGLPGDAAGDAGWYSSAEAKSTPRPSPPASSTVPSGSSVAVVPFPMSVLWLAVTVQDLAPGSYSSAWRQQNATSTVPSGSSVAVTTSPGGLPAAVHVPFAGS